MRIVKTLPALLLLLALLLTACSTGGSSTPASGSSTRPAAGEKQLSVVTTIFPTYDWARQIIGADNERVELMLLLDKGADLHSYQPTVEDIYTISTCDLFIYVGGESDKWVPNALAQATNKSMTVICLLDLLGDAAKEEEVVEGMDADHDGDDHAHDADDHDHDGDDHDHDADDHDHDGDNHDHDADDHDHDGDDHDHDADDHDHDHGLAYDEHVWLSLRHAQTLCNAIRDGLIACDPAGESAYRANCAAYTKQLAAVDASFSELVAGAGRKTLLFADRFPFRYFTDDYGLTYHAAFLGCSAETEASFETINFLVTKVDELELPYIIKLEQSDSRLADTIIESSKAQSAQVLELNSLQAVTAQGVAEGVTYIGVMEQNLEVLKTALGAQEADN